MMFLDCHVKISRDDMRDDSDAGYEPDETDQEHLKEVLGEDVTESITEA